MKKISTISVVLILITYSALILTGCGRNRTNNEQIDGNGGLSMLHSPETIRLSVSAPTLVEFHFRQAFTSFQQSMEQEGVAVYLEFCGFDVTGTEEYYNQLLSRFAAGTGPDLFFATVGPSLIPFMDNGFLGDFYTLIDQSPTMNRDDFFMNVLESLEIDGRLYYMPIKFFHEFIGINANVPQEFIERFAALGQASVSDIVVLYMELINQHPEFADYALIHGMDAAQALAPELSYLIDITNRSADFTSVDTLFNAVRIAFASNNLFGTPTMQSFPSYDYMELLQSRYIFAASTQTVGLEAVLDYSQSFFIHHVPRASESGQLVLLPRNSLAISHTADPLILYFMKYYIQQMANASVVADVLGVPILRELYPEALEAGVRNHFDSIERAMLSGVEQVYSVIARIGQYTERQSTIAVINTLFSLELYTSTVSEILATDVPTHEAVRRLEQYFNTWLNPDFTIAPLPVPVVVDRDDPNIRILTVLTPDRHIGVVRQAANELNAAWASEGRDYQLYIVIDSYNWESAPSVHARLQTELMAGMGPDLFIWNGQPMHAYARSGLLANIYDLIDECSQISQADFFTQALSAFEMSGGLYMFPLSFGFQYVAINNTLPQSVQDRFAQLSSISVYELFLMYHEIMAEYGEDFGHLALVEPLTNVELRYAIFGGFIDFDARRSNLMDDRFISLLENWANRDEAWPAMIMSYAGVNFDATFIRRMANSYVFMIDRGD